MCGEVVRRADDGGPEVGRDANGHHVLRDVLPELNASVVTGGHEIDTAVVGRDLKLDGRIVTSKLSELRTDDRLGGKALERIEFSNRSIVFR